MSKTQRPQPAPPYNPSSNEGAVWIALVLTAILIVIVILLGVMYG